jgi:putative tryptophan/tyrosine transport system substrate-binding protein
MKKLIQPKTLVLYAVLLSILSWSCGTGDSSPYTIAIVNPSHHGDRIARAFQAELLELGYQEDETVRFLYPGMLREPADMVEWVQSLQEGEPDLFIGIVDAATEAIVAARPGDETPILFWMASDPVKAGLADTVRRPGGRFSGVTTVFEGSLSEGRRLELLLMMDPEVETILVPHNPDDPAVRQSMATVRDAARYLGVTLVEKTIHSPGEASALLEAFPPEVDAVFLLPDRVLGTIREPLAHVAIDRGIPYSGPVENSVNDGALMAYSFSEESIGKILAHMAQQIQKGVPVGELPLETPEFVLALNLAVADQISLEVPGELLRQATTIVRDWP